MSIRFVPCCTRAFSADGFAEVEALLGFFRLLHIVGPPTLDGRAREAEIISDPKLLDRQESLNFLAAVRTCSV